MTATFYKYTKERILFNKTPWLDPDTAVVINDTHVAGDQDIENPTLTVEATAVRDPMQYTYCYIQEWNRYYFITSRRWLSGGVYQITLQEDYIFTAKTILETLTGYCRYSGLGDSNLIDPRVSFNPQSAVSAYDIFFDNQNAVPLQNWYCMKFLSTDPFQFNLPHTVPDHYVINIAIMNEDSYKQFITSYIALSELDRTRIAPMILSINRVQYIAPDPTALADYKVSSIGFTTPFNGDYITYNYTAADPAVQVVVNTGSTSEYETYIVSYPDVVADIFNRRGTVVDVGTSTAHKFNTNDRFWELNAQYTLKLAELQPIPFDPTIYGKKSSFTIYFDISYEPYSENYIVKFYPDLTGKGNQTPFIQKCVTSIPFMSDTTLDNYELRNMTSALSMAQKIAGGFGAMAGSFAAQSAGGVIGGLATAISGPLNFQMEWDRQRLQYYTGFGTTGAVGGSTDWVHGGVTEPLVSQMYVITQQPISTPWGYRGMPDGHWRSILSLAATGYAEVDLVDMTDNILYLTENELIRTKEAMANGVIFNATPTP